MHITRWKVLGSFVVVGGLLVSGCANDEASDGASDKTTVPEATAPDGGGGGGTGAAAGGKTFSSSCASCHGKDAQGLPNLGKDLTTSEYAKGLSDEELVAFIKVGRTTDDPLNTTGVMMPPKGGNPALSDEDLAAVVTYLRSIEK